MNLGIGKAAFAGWSARASRPEPGSFQRIEVFASLGDTESPTDEERRMRILRLLYCRHAAEGEEIVYRNALPPIEWINAQLAARGEKWRVTGTSGTACDIRELEAA